MEVLPQRRRDDDDSVLRMTCWWYFISLSRCASQEQQRIRVVRKREPLPIDLIAVVVLSKDRTGTRPFRSSHPHGADVVGFSFCWLT